MENVSIDGLKGLSYVDKTLEGIPTVTEERESVKLAGWTDRVYLSTPDTLTLNNVSSSGQNLIFLELFNPISRRIAFSEPSLPRENCNYDPLNKIRLN